MIPTMCLPQLKPLRRTTEEDDPEDVLAALDLPDEAEEEDTLDDLLAGLDPIEEDTAEDDTDDVLAGLEPVEETEEAESADVLASLELSGNPEAEGEGAEDILAGLETLDDGEQEDQTEDILAELEAVGDADSEDDIDGLLAELEPEEAEEGLEPAARESLADTSLEIERAGETPDDPEPADSAADDLDALLNALDEEDTDAEAEGGGAIEAS